MYGLVSTSELKKEGNVKCNCTVLYCINKHIHKHTHKDTHRYTHTESHIILYRYTHTFREHIHNGTSNHGAGGTHYQAIHRIPNSPHIHKNPTPFQVFEESSFQPASASKVTLTDNQGALPSRRCLIHSITTLNVYFAVSQTLIRRTSTEADLPADLGS